MTQEKLNLATAEEYYRNYKLDEAQAILDEILAKEPANITALLLLGKICTKTQNYGEAINSFNAVLSNDSFNKEAETGLQLIKNILQLTNNYYYENAYTDEGLYDFDK